jgi:hypothetical protein
MENAAAGKSACIDIEVLRRFSLGELAPAEAEAVERHLLACEVCVTTLRSLEVKDCLSQAVRGQAKLPDIAVVERQLADVLIARLKELCPDPPDTQTDEGRLTSVSEAGVSGTYKADLTFLAPPQGPGELGRLDNFRVLDVIGQGGMGVVLHAEDTVLGRAVAIKVMNPSLLAAGGARERFLREARSAARINHPHVVTIHHVGEEKGAPFLVMPLLQGESLADRLRREGRLPSTDVVRIGREAAEGLAAAHACGLVHRDVKPANLWLESVSDGPGPSATPFTVKVLDFGLARADRQDKALTQEGMLLGTPQYMAPEQWRGKAVDGRSDLFALGVVLYEMATGELPFKGTDAAAVLRALELEQPTAPRELRPDLPMKLAALIGRLLAKAPQDRPASAREVADALRAMEGENAARDLSGEKAAEPTPAVAGTLIGVGGPPQPGADDWPEPMPPVGPGLPARPAGGRGAAGLRPPKRRWVVAAALLLALVPLGYFFGGTMIRFITNEGQVLIEADDPNIEVTIKDQTGTVHDRGSHRKYTVRASGGLMVAVTVKDASGDEHQFATREFTLRRGGKQVLRIGVELIKVEPPQAGDRKAAEWVLSLGGQIRVHHAGEYRQVQKRADLPAEAFRLVGVDLQSNRSVDNAGLAHLSGVTNLTSLILDGTQVSDEGLKHLKGLERLDELRLSGTQVGNSGLAHLRGLTNLRFIDLRETKISDAGLAHLKSMTKLTRLDLPGTQVGNSGLAHLKDMTNLNSLNLEKTKLSDSGLAHLQGLTQLTYLSLAQTKVSDLGLKYLKGMTQLADLQLNKTQVSDPGVGHLLVLKKLTDLHLEYTRVSARGHDTLRTAFPPPRAVRWSEANREAARAVLDLGGAVHVRPEGGKEDRLVKNAADLPKKYFRVTRARLACVRKPLGEPLRKLAALTDLGLDWLAALDVSDSAVTHEDLKPLHGLTALKELDLTGTKVTPEEIAALQKALPKCHIVSGLKEK